MDPKDVHSMSTPAHKDKRFWSTALVAAVIILNHRLGLELSSSELCILAALVGAFSAQSQIGELSKLKAVLGASSTPDAPPDPPTGG